MVNNDLDSELSAMQTIAMTLGELDPPMRARVLRWLQERYRDEGSSALSLMPEVAAVTRLRAVPPRPIVPDEFLAVEHLADMFKPREREPEAAAPPLEQPVTALLHEFVAEFQDLAREWDGATHSLPAAS